MDWSSTPLLQYSATQEASRKPEFPTEGALWVGDSYAGTLDAIEGNNLLDHTAEPKNCGLQTYSQHLDTETGYIYYEDEASGECYWDRPLGGAMPLRPEEPDAEDVRIDSEREERCHAEKEARRRDMAKLRALLDRQVMQETLAKDIKDTQRVRALWSEAEDHAVRKKGSMALSWQQVNGMSEKHVFGFHGRHGIRLVSLRLVGLGLCDIPGAIGQHLWSLKSLSLSSNLLTEVPDGLCDLTGLEDLNLVRNKLQTLPERIGNLRRLRHFFVAGNRLEVLPPSFGDLTELYRVVLDGNSLRKLPDTLGNLNCRYFNVNNNRLVALPHCLKDMPRLQILAANSNELQFLPSDIGYSASIVQMHLASNQLIQLPESICRMTKLKVLWLDHNNITGLPTRFHDLKSLEKLLLERNDMVYPPPEIVRGGCEKVRVWCARRFQDRISTRRHAIVMAVQNMLKQVQDRDLAPSSFFEAEVRMGDGQEDRYYALIYERFWDTLLPALEKEWESNARPAKGGVSSFNYTREEVDEVLQSFCDPVGRILRTRKQMFRRCACLDSNGRRRVCVPPKIGWMCEREATLIRHDIVLGREHAERQRRAMEQEDIEFRVTLVKKLVKDRSETDEGKKEYSVKAVKMAEEFEKKKQLGKAKDKFEAVQTRRRKALERKMSRKREALIKERESRLQELRSKAADLGKEVKKLRGWAKERKEAEIDQVRSWVKGADLLSPC